MTSRRRMLVRSHTRPVAAERVLSVRELNRALLARQLLLERRKLGVQEAVERLCAVQAQWPQSPYLALWTRLTGFRKEHLTRALEERKVIKSTLFRITLHMTSARDYPYFVAARSPRLDTARDGREAGRAFTPCAGSCDRGTGDPRAGRGARVSRDGRFPLAHADAHAPRPPTAQRHLEPLRASAATRDGSRTRRRRPDAGRGCGTSRQELLRGLRAGDTAGPAPLRRCPSRRPAGRFGPRRAADIPRRTGARTSGPPARAAPGR